MEIKKSKVLSLFLTFCMVLSLMSVSSLTAQAAVSEKYQIGGTYLDMDGVTIDPVISAWVWDGTTKTLTFKKTTTITAESTEGYAMVGMGLPADTTIVIESGIVVNVHSNVSDAIFCEGKLTIRGNGTLKAKGGTQSIAANLPGYAKDDTVTGSGIQCYGGLVIGDETADEKTAVLVASNNNLPYALCVGSETSGDETLVAINSGQLEMESSGAINCGSSDKKVVLNSNNVATLIYTGKNANTDKSTVVCAKTRGDSYNYSKDGDYYMVMCFATNTDATGGGTGQTARERILVKDDSGFTLDADWTGTVVPDSEAKIFLGWNTTQNAEAPLDSATYTLPDITDYAELSLYAVYGNRAVIDPLPTPNYTTGKLTGLESDATYEITYIDVEGNEKTDTVTNPVNGETELKPDYYGQNIFIVKKGDPSADPVLYDSVEKAVAIKDKLATPEVGVDYVNDTFTGLEAAAKYTILIKGVGSRVSTGSDIKLSDYYGETVSFIKESDDTDNVLDSDASAEITVSSRPDTPIKDTDFTVTEAIKGVNSEKATIDFTNTATIYQIKIDDGEWTDVTSSTTVDPDSTVQIRVKVTDSTPASLPSTEFTTQKAKEPTPNPSVDYIAEKLTGLNPNEKYSISGQEFTADAEGKIALAGEGYDLTGSTISVVKVKTSDAYIDSDAKTGIVINGRPDTPTETDINKTVTTDGTKFTVNSDYAYKIGDNEWTTLSSEVIIDALAGQEVQVKIAATVGTPESEVLTFTATKKEMAPDAAGVDYKNSTITGLESGEDYIVTVGEGENKKIIGEDTANDNGEITVDLSEVLPDDIISVVKKGDTAANTEDSASKEISASAPNAIPDVDKVTVTEADASNTDPKAVVTIDNPEKYEYQDENGEWKQIPDDGIKVVPGDSVDIRTAATESNPASDSITVSTKRIAEVPDTAAIDYTKDAEGLKGLDDGSYVVTDKDGNIIAEGMSSDGKLPIDKEKLEALAGTDITVVKKGDDTTVDSAPKTLTVAVPAEAPSMDKVTVTEADASDTDPKAVVTIDNPEKYEYKDENGEWKQVPVDGIKVVPGDSVDIRTAATESNPASDSINVSTKRIAEVPDTAAIDYTKDAEGLKGLDDGSYVVTDKDGNIIAEGVSSDGKLPIDKEKLEALAGTDIAVVKKGDDTTVDSAPKTLTVATPAEAPSKDNFTVIDAVEGEKEATIKGITTAQEYSTDGGATWIPGTGADVKVPAGTEVLIRDKATEDKPASESIELITKDAPVKTQEAAPNAVVDYAAEKLTGLVPNAEYVVKVDDKTVTFKADAEGKTDAAMYYGKTIAIIKKGNNTTTTDSVEQKLTVAAKAAAPAEDKFTIIESTTDAGDVIIKNVTSDYEYSTDNGTTWKPGDGSDVIVPAGTTVLIRQKATAATPASETVTITATSYESAEKVEQQIINANTDTGDPACSTFGTLRLKAVGKSKSVKLTWKKVKEADGYIVYGSACGSKMKKITTVKGASKITWTQKKLNKGKYYKYIVSAYKTINGKDYIIATSKSAHATTTGGKYGNPTKVSVKSSKVTIKKGKKSTIKASYVAAKKIRIHIAKFRYESSNTKVATVTKKGVIKGKSKGKATIYVYAQNGIYKTVKVTVK